MSLVTNTTSAEGEQQIDCQRIVFSRRLHAGLGAGGIGHVAPVLSGHRLVGCPAHAIADLARQGLAGRECPRRRE